MNLKYLIANEGDYFDGNGTLVKIENGVFSCDVSDESGYAGGGWECSIDELEKHIEKYKQALRRKQATIQEYVDKKWDDGKYTVIAASGAASRDYEGLLLIHNDTHKRYILACCYDSGIVFEEIVLPEYIDTDFIKQLACVLNGGKENKQC